MPERKITPQQHRFIAGIIRGHPAGKSAIDAGYSERSARSIGPELLKRPAITREIDRQLNAAGVSPQRILAELWDLYEMARDAGSHGPAKDILALLGRHAGLFPDQRKVQHTHSHSFEHLLDASNKIQDVTPANPVLPIAGEKNRD